MKDINQNRRRVQTILKRLVDAERVSNIYHSRSLALEELLSEEWHLELDKTLVEGELDSSRIVTKIRILDRHSSFYHENLTIW